MREGDEINLNNINHQGDPASRWFQRATIIENMLPEFVEMCKGDDTKDIIINASAFADTPRETELLGLAIQYATERGFSVTVIPYKPPQPKGEKER